MPRNASADRNGPIRSYKAIAFANVAVGMRAIPGSGSAAYEISPRWKKYHHPQRTMTIAAGSQTAHVRNTCKRRANIAVQNGRKPSASELYLVKIAAEAITPNKAA